ncbi:unnamed protein product, partial [Gulo gulo]
MQKSLVEDSLLLGKKVCAHTRAHTHSPVVWALACGKKRLLQLELLRVSVAHGA